MIMMQMSGLPTVMMSPPVVMMYPPTVMMLLLIMMTPVMDFYTPGDDICTCGDDIWTPHALSVFDSLHFDTLILTRGVKGFLTLFLTYLCMHTGKYRHTGRLRGEKMCLVHLM